MQPELLIGAARQVITPDLGCQMAGFDARKGVALKVHDDLHSRALVLDDGNTKIALVSVEVIALAEEFTDLVRSRVEQATGIPSRNVIISATHTHCGPVTISHFFNQGQFLDETYLARLSSSIVASIETAFFSRQPRGLRSGLVPVNDIAVNRRSADGQPIDRYAGVLVAEELDGAPAVVVINYPCHPTVLGPNTLELSADFPFYTTSRLRQDLGANTEILYFNGTGGDVSIGHKSDLSAVGVVAPFRTFEKAEELGHRLADAVKHGLPDLIEQSSLGVERCVVSLPLKRYPPLADMTMRRERAAGDLRQLEREDGATEQLLAAKQRSLCSRIEEYYASLYEQAQGPEPKTVEVELVAVRIGETALLSFPAEVFVGIGLDIRQRSGFRTTMFLGLANGYIGYVPTADANASGGYEAVASRLAPSAAGILTDNSVALLNKLAHRSQEAGTNRYEPETKSAIDRTSL